MPSAYVLMKCEEGAENRIIKNLTKTDVIREVQPTIGHYDLIAKITSSSIEDMDEIIQQIHKDEKIHSTKVLRMNE
ncbi:MAG: Lrp/AsnC ligand binding domain-containing protein [Thaumarchaeota archaeon]|nr:Lrp/AsnC ligand binding domain-containing protein [Nitrososphaerota archaeon]